LNGSTFAIVGFPDKRRILTKEAEAESMFGHQRGAGIPDEPEAQVEMHLELDIDEVEKSVTSFLQNPTDGSRKALLDELEKLDDQISLGDSYAASIVDSGVLGQSSKGDVLGETSSHPFVEEVPSAFFRAQVALVRAAKNVVRGRGLDAAALADLRAASDALNALQTQPEGG
jgi:hypothetical protein